MHDDTNQKIEIWQYDHVLKANMDELNIWHVTFMENEYQIPYKGAWDRAESQLTFQL